MIRPIAVEPREGYRVWLRYPDGAKGEVDLSHLAGRGVFKAWDDRACFETVHDRMEGLPGVWRSNSARTPSI